LGNGSNFLTGGRKKKKEKKRIKKAQRLSHAVAVAHQPSGREKEVKEPSSRESSRQSHTVTSLHDMKTQNGRGGPSIGKGVKSPEKRSQGFGPQPWNRTGGTKILTAVVGQRKTQPADTLRNKWKSRGETHSLLGEKEKKLRQGRQAGGVGTRQHPALKRAKKRV